MLVWNDLEADEKVKVYDKGVKVTNDEGLRVVRLLEAVDQSVKVRGRAVNV
jgi:hypothetical protein